MDPKKKREADQERSRRTSTRFSIGCMRLSYRHIVVLQEKARQIDQAPRGDDRLMKWLNCKRPLCISVTLGEGVGLIFSPAEVIFAGIGVFLLAAKDVSASHDAVVDLFEKIEFFFKRLEACTE
ncbi:hypothetical protein EDB87DRAFT_1581200 [Lactarius vividus]|nr:hypothetical protein EDB87DRAFT_1581200 [Lactarius vividus]